MAKQKPKVINLVDWSGGYAVDLQPELMDPNMMLIAENLWYQEGLEKRGGKSTYSDLSAYTAVRGGIKAWLDGDWHQILAVEVSNAVNFYSGTSNVFAALSSAVDWTEGNDVELAQLDDEIVAVNGADRPVAIWLSGTIQVEDLDNHDERARGYDDWVAGFYDASAVASAPLAYLDDTVDAQNEEVLSNFLLAGTTAGDGFYIGCDFTFSKVTLYGVPVMSAAVGIQWQYSTGSNIFTTMPAALIETDPDWTAGGDLVLEFDYLSNFVGTTIDNNPTVSLNNISSRFMLRGLWTSAPAASHYCDYFAVDQTHYLTYILFDEKPQAVAVHQDTMFIAANSVVNWAPAGTIVNWHDYDLHGFYGGGPMIIGMRSFKGNLCVFKDTQIQGMFGNAFENPTVQVLEEAGAVSNRSIVATEDQIAFQSLDGIRVFNGDYSRRVSKHIKSDIDGWCTSNVAGGVYEGDFFFSYPSDGIVLTFDPDTVRQAQEDKGEWRASFYKWTDYYVDLMMMANGAEDTGDFYGINNTSGPVMIQIDDGNDYDGASQAIAVDFQTPYLSWGAFQSKKQQNRLKIDTSKASNITGNIYAEHGDQTTSFVYDTGTGSGHFNKEVSLHYSLDGRNLSVRLRNETVNPLAIYGIALDVMLRRF